MKVKGSQVGWGFWLQWVLASAVGWFVAFFLGWVLGDIIVHVTAYERGLVEWLEAARRGDVKTFADLDHPDVDYRNEVILEESQGRSLEEIEAEAGRVFGRLMELVEAERVEWYVKPRWGERHALWECIADDSYRHYMQHMEDVHRWLEEERDSS